RLHLSLFLFFSIPRPPPNSTLFPYTTLFRSSSGFDADSINKSELKTQELVVGASGFEPETSCAQGRRATRLRYAPTMTALFILKHFPTLLLIRVVIFCLTVPKLCQILLLNRSCARFQRHLVGLTVHFLQGLSLHLQFHLRILFEDLGVALSKELCNPLVGDTACTEPRRIGGAQVIDPEVGNSCAFQCLPPCSLEILMVTGRIFVSWEQEGPDPRDQHLALEGFDRQRRQGNFSDTVRGLGVGYPNGGIHKVHLVLPHGCELLVHPESRLRDDLNDIPKMWRSL